jgi:hypothetical protein
MGLGGAVLAAKVNDLQVQVPPGTTTHSSIHTQQPGGGGWGQAMFLSCARCRVIPCNPT